MQGAKYDIVAKDKVQAFVTLMDEMSKKLGSCSAACKYARIQQSNWVHISRGDKNLNIDLAKKILAAHKRLKESANV